MNELLKTFLTCLFLMVMVTIAYNSTAQELPPPPSSITVSWSVPIERENGTLLSVDEIAGYELHTSCIENFIAIVGGDVTSFTLDIALPYSCNFTVLTVDTDGLRSEPSDILTVTFNSPKPPFINEIMVN